MRCINYGGHISKSGYGLDYDPTTQKTVLAHRKAFKDKYGYAPEVVMHKCDNPACVNPDHLVAGTQSDNIKDCVSKGRHHNVRKLSSKQCADIIKDSRPQRVIAKQYEVHQGTISNIKRGKYDYCGS